jgi:uncharacterized protein YndB with AHSA1/START domain
MKWVLIIVGVLVVIATVVWAIGAAIPREHSASRMARYRQPPEKIWAAITDVESFPQWRKDMKSVKRLPDVNGKPAWVETHSTGEMPLVVEEWNPPQRLVMRIVDEKLPFGGTWTFEISVADGGATLRLTENGFVKPAIFRFLSKYIFGYTATMEEYLKDLGRKFGEDVTPQP